MTEYEVSWAGRSYIVTSNPDGTFNWPNGLPKISRGQNTIASNVLRHGTGGLNIGACRVGYRAERPLNRLASIGYGGSEAQGAVNDGGVGRWPANVVFSHSEDCTEDFCTDGCPVVELDRQSGTLTSGVLSPANNTKASNNDCMSGPNQADRVKGTFGGDSGGASRFFPCFRFEAKAPGSERPRIAGESHSTVKPLGLLRHFARLITPPGGTILDCFAGTGSTGQAARAEGFPCILIDDDPQAMEWIRARLDARPKTEAPAAGEMIVEPEGDLLDLLDLLDDDEADAS